MKQTIAVDIDDVLAANAEAFVAYGNKRWGTNLTVEDYREHWGEMWQLEHEELEKFAQEYHISGEIGRYRHTKEAKFVLKKLSNLYNIVIITSRRTVVQKETLEWIDRYYRGIFNDVRFAGFFDNKFGIHLTKAEIAKELNAAFLIDDQLKHCLAAAEAGLTGLLFGDYAWNRTTEPLPNGCVRVKDWLEVEKFFDAQAS